jgi:hypothetical protein
VIAHLAKFRSMCAQAANFCRLEIWGWMFCNVSKRMARSSAYADVVQDDENVLKW